MSGVFGLVGLVFIGLVVYYFGFTWFTCLGCILNLVFGCCDCAGLSVVRFGCLVLWFGLVRFV